jgi:ligand-binding sensor domain-containing protein
LNSPHVAGLAIDRNAPSTIYAANAFGLSRSTDGGASWVSINSGFTALSVTAVVVDPGNSSTIYAGTTDGVFKTTNGAGSWAAVSTGLSTRSVSVLVIDPVTPTTLYLGTPGGVFKTVNGGGVWTAVNDGLTELRVLALAIDPAAPANVYAGTQGSGGFKIAFSACSPGATALCLNDGRFRVQVAWVASNIPASGSGQAVPVTGDTGAFWFFSSNNLELIIKVVDGRAFNGYYWVFYGALSNVEYTITVTDTVTGSVKTYSNPQGTLASVADTAAFFAGASATEAPR